MSKYTLTITLRNGEAQSFTVSKMPRHWKSWLMHKLPYGTDFQGCSFHRIGIVTRISSKAMVI